MQDRLIGLEGRLLAPTHECKDAQWCTRLYVCLPNRCMRFNPRTFVSSSCSRRYPFHLLVVVSVLFGACGDDPVTTTPPTATEATATDEAGLGYADVIQAVRSGQFSDECLLLFGDFVQEIESLVEPVPWSTLSVDKYIESDTFSDIAVIAGNYEPRATALQCEAFNFVTIGATSTFFVGIAVGRAPGTLEYLDFTLTSQAPALCVGWPWWPRGAGG